MGSWNGTCALTNLPIMSGEKVYVLLLQESKHYDKYVGNHCYPNTYYQPLPLYFQGEYNSYGAVKNCHGEFLDDILDLVKEKLIEFDEGKNQYHDIPVKKEIFDIDLLFDADREARLFVEPSSYDKNEGIEKIRLTHIIIRKDVVEKLLTDYKIEYSTPSKYRDKKTTYAQGLEQFYNEFHHEISKLSTTLGLEFINCSNFYKNPLVAYVFENSRVAQKTIDIAQLIRKYFGTDKLKSLYSNLAVIGVLSDFMSNGRYQWIKPSGSGSQNSEVTAQTLMSKLITQGVKGIKQYYKDNDW